MSETGPIRILIVDDHPIVRDGFAALIERRPDMTVVALANVTEAKAAFLKHQPDVTLMDLRLSGEDGVVAIQAIRHGFPEARMLVVTTFDGDADIQRALQAGVRGYILKDAHRDELMEAIRTVRNGGIYLPSDVAAKLAEHDSAPVLSVRERSVLALVAQGKSNAEIGTVLTITEGTVKLHINSILSKLRASDRTHAVVIGIRRGIIRLD